MCVLFQKGDFIPEYPKLDIEPDDGEFNFITPRSRMVTMRGRYWPIGYTLRVRFFGGSPRVRAKVEYYARKWLKYANLKMRFVDSGTADIRITFDQNDGNHSVIGTEARERPQDQPTMNLRFFDSMPEWGFASSATHEFGHALGCIHENVNPSGRIPWDEEAVYKYYANSPLDKAAIKEQILDRYSKDLTQFSKHDPGSIMSYSAPAHLRLDKRKMRQNFYLSKTDKEFIATIYPRRLDDPKPRDDDNFIHLEDKDKDWFPGSQSDDDFCDEEEPRNLGNDF